MCRLSSAGEFCSTALSGLLADSLRLPGLPLHGPQSHGMAAGREPGVFLPLPGAAVPLHREKPAGLGRGLEPDRGGPADGPDRHRAVLLRCPTCPGWAATSTCATTRPARRWRSASTPSSAWRWPSGWPAPQGLLLIAVLIGVCVPLFNVAAVWPMARHAQTRLPAGAAAQSADHRHRSGPGGQSAGLGDADLAGADAEPHRCGLAGAGPDGRGRGHAVRQPGAGQGADGGGAGDPPLHPSAGGVRAGALVAAGPGAGRRAAGLLGPARLPRAPMCWLRAWATTALMWPGWSRCPPCWAC